jgi:trimethylamine--corrinoid protein Co-methyltransferase
METPRGEYLSPDDIERIHHTSMRLLEEVGIQFSGQEAVEIFKQHGFRTENNKVYFEADRVMEAVGTAPSQFTLHARNPERTVTVGGGQPVFAPGYGAPFVVDWQTGKRQATMQDYENLASLAHALPNQDVSGHLIVEPGDVPAADAHLRMLYASIQHSDKPFMGSTEGELGAKHTMDIIKILFGETLEKPVVVGLINPLSPLGYSREMGQAIILYAKAGQPVIIASLVMAGSTGPITLAGVLAQQNAEVLAGVVLGQLVRPGTPVLYGSTSTNIEMKTGALAIGSPEMAMLVSAHAQMARYYGLPSRAGGSLTDACSPDAQAGSESMFALLTTVSSGVDFILHSGGILNSFLAFSYEKFVLDDEMCGMVRRYQNGIEVSDETLAFDVIKEVGSSGNFLMHMHTVERCRSEFWVPPVANRTGLDSWMNKGMETAGDRAHMRWVELLESHEDPALDVLIERQLREYIESQTG